MKKLLFLRDIFDYNIPPRNMVCQNLSTVFIQIKIEIYVIFCLPSVYSSEIYHLVITIWHYSPKIIQC